MTSPDTPRCPQCHDSVPLISLFPWPMRGGAFRLAPNLGVECPHCGTKLLIVQTRVYAALGFLFLVLLFGASGFASLTHKALSILWRKFRRFARLEQSSAWHSCPSSLRACGGFAQFVTVKRKPWCFRSERPRQKRTRRPGGYALNAMRRIQRTSKFAGSASMLGRRPPASNNRWRDP